MAIEKLERDLAVISKLSDYPGSQDGLSTDEFKSKFDEAALAIQDYINDVLVPALIAIAPGDDANIYLPLKGGKMKGDVDMGGNRVTGLADPVDDGDAVPMRSALLKTGGTMYGNISMSGYTVNGLGSPTEDTDAATKGYVDEKHLSGEVALPASGWVSGLQEVAVAGILATDRPHWGIIYNNAPEAEKEAFSLVDVLETEGGRLRFRCFGDAPKVDLTIQWEVNR